MTARLILAALLLAMAAGQLSDVPGFVDILETYEVGPDWLAAAFAPVIIILEIAGGAGILIKKVRIPGAIIALIVAVAWTLLGAQAFARGLDLQNCGCFGVHLGQELRWWVLLEDAEFIFIAAWVLWRSLPRPFRAAENSREAVAATS